MTEAVVDLLEVVDVDEAERERGMLFLGVQELALKALVEMTMVPEAREWIGEGESHRAQRSVCRSLVEGDGEQWSDECYREHGGAFPQNDEHQRGGGHERERDDRRADVGAHQARVLLPGAEGDRT